MQNIKHNRFTKRKELGDMKEKQIVWTKIKQFNQLDIENF